MKISAIAILIAACLLLPNFAHAAGYGEPAGHGTWTTGDPASSQYQRQRQEFDLQRSERMHRRQMRDLEMRRNELARQKMHEPWYDNDRFSR